MRKILVYILAGLLLSGVCFSREENKVTGRILNHEGKPLAGAKAEVLLSQSIEKDTIKGNGWIFRLTGITKYVILSSRRKPTDLFLRQPSSKEESNKYLSN